MRIFMIGDVVGKSGRRILEQRLSEFRQERKIDMVIANVENAAGGSGLTVKNYQELKNCGIDCMTLGDHAFRQKEIFPILESETDIVRPANYPKSAPGKGVAILEVPGNSEHGPLQMAVISLVGRVFMQPVNSPFDAIDEILTKIPESVKVKLIDFHAEATSEMQSLGRYLDGRVSAVLGTHTHVATADETIYPNGTAFQCDIGMTGAFESIIGRKIEPVLETTRTFRPTVFEVAAKDLRINGTLVDIDPISGKAKKIERAVIFE